MDSNGAQDGDDNPGLNQEKVNKQQRSQGQGPVPSNPQSGPPKESAATLGHLVLALFVSKPVAQRPTYDHHHANILQAELKNSSETLNVYYNS